MIQGWVLRTGIGKFETYENFSLFQTYRNFWILKLGLPNSLSFKGFYHFCKHGCQLSYNYAEHWKKILNVFGGDLMCMKFPPNKEEK